MKLRIVLLLLFLVGIFASLSVSAETENAMSDDTESFNLAGIYHSRICRYRLGLLPLPVRMGHFANHQKGKKPLYRQESCEM